MSWERAYRPETTTKIIYDMARPADKPTRRPFCHFERPPRWLWMRGIGDILRGQASRASVCRVVVVVCNEMSWRASEGGIACWLGRYVTGEMQVVVIVVYGVQQGLPSSTCVPAYLHYQPWMCVLSVSCCVSGRSFECHGPVYTAKQGRAVMAVTRCAPSIVTFRKSRTTNTTQAA